MFATTNFRRRRIEFTYQWVVTKHGFQACQTNLQKTQRAVVYWSWCYVWPEGGKCGKWQYCEWEVTDTSAGSMSASVWYEMKFERFVKFHQFWRCYAIIQWLILYLQIYSPRVFGVCFCFVIIGIKLISLCFKIAFEITWSNPEGQRFFESKFCLQQFWQLVEGVWCLFCLQRPCAFDKK
jgi:hypothetical protein